MPLNLTASGTSFFLHTAPTKRMKLIASKYGGRKIAAGFKFPRLLSVAEGLRKDLPDLVVPDTSTMWGNGYTDHQVEVSSNPYRHKAWVRLRPYQKAAVQYLVNTPLPGAMLMLSPRLGKTPVAIVAAEILGAQNVLIVAPLSLQRTWVREAAIWGSHAITRAHNLPPGMGWTITNYDTLVKYDRLERANKGRNPYKVPWDLIIVDESLLIKNRKTQRYKAIKAIRDKATRRWALTGSPISRFGDDLWTQFNYIFPQGFASYWRFAEDNCEIERTVWGVNVAGTQPDVDFAQKYRDIMFVRNWKDVATMAPLTQEFLDLDLTPEQEKIYDEVTNTFIASLEAGTLTVPNRMAQITRQIQIASNLANIGGKDVSSKAGAILEMIEAGTIEYPCLIWVHWRQGATALFQRIVDFKKKESSPAVNIVLGGDPQADEKIEWYKAFEAGTPGVLLLSLEIGKYGHTLANTQTVIYLDRTFNADTMLQSWYRVELPDLPQGAQVITLRCPGTADDMVEDNLAGKMPDIARASNADLAKYLRAIRGNA